MNRRRLAAIGAAAGLLAFLWAIPAASLAAGALLRPARTRVQMAPPPHCEDARLQGAGITLAGWRCGAEGPPRGTVVYLHGIADTRASGAGTIDRFRRTGLDVVAYDSRAHGDSGGDFCTYGYFEKRDLRRVIETLAPGPVVLIGTSLGAAVALQAAAEDARVSGVVAAEVFSDLRTIARERAPFFLTDGIVDRALRIAGRRGGFDADAVSPVEAARRIRVPALLVHGAVDADTPPAHSQRVFDALAGPKRLILVDGAAHNRSLSGSAVWGEIDRWVRDVVGSSRLKR